MAQSHGFGAEIKRTAPATNCDVQQTLEILVSGMTEHCTFVGNVVSLMTFSTDGGTDYIQYVCERARDGGWS